MKKEEVIFYTIIIIIILLLNVSRGDVSKSKNFIPGEIIIKYKDNIIGNGNEIIVDNEILVYEYVEKPDGSRKITPNLEIYNLKFDNLKSIDEIINDYKSIEEIEYVEQNYKMDVFIIPDDTNYSLKWDLKNINAEEAWNLTIGNESISIAIIDTGVDWNHPDLMDNIWNNSNEYCNISLDNDNNSYNGDCRGYDFTDINTTSYIDDGYSLDSSEDYNVSDNNPMDFDGHGTHVAGIVASVSNNSLGMTGACWNCSIMPVRAGFKINHPSQGWIGTLELDDVASALYYASDNNATIISMSFGGSHSATLQDAINYSYSNGSVLVASAGNSGTNSKIYPCGYDNVICVGAIDDDNTSASYSNYGNWIKIAAPGSLIWSTYFNDVYTSLSGTSMSAPVVAGSIGLIKTLFPSKNQSEIEEALNNTGNLVNFTNVMLSRINIYSAILSLDNISPNVSLISPFDNHINLTLNQTFSCNASDWQIKNITLNIWNSTNLYYNSSTNVDGIFNQTSFNVSMNYGSYKWNCLVYDNESNYAYANSNFSLFIENVTVSLLSPNNNTYKNTNETYFNCSTETESTKYLINLSFSLWNTTNLVFNKINNISGFSNSSSFNYNFSVEETYLWNCRAYNNESESDIADSNFTIIYDITKPNITIESPNDEISFTSNSQRIDFEFNVTDNFEISNCSLIINGNINSTNSSINESLTQNFSIPFTPGSYTWNINCSDNAINQINSSTRSFIITAPANGGGGTSGGGGGGGGSSISSLALIPKTFIISNEQASSGYTKELGEQDKIRFSFFDKETIQHSLIINEIGADYVNITINSTPINLFLGIGQSVKLNLTNSDYYDLFVKLNYIKNNKVEITIQIINELIPKPSISSEVIKNDNPQTSDNESLYGEIDKLNKNIRELKFILNILVLIIIIILILFFYKQKNNLKIKNRKK